MSDKKIQENPDVGMSNNKPSIPFAVIIKPRSVMGDYIALHGLVPQNELPKNLRHKIPNNEIWIREDVYNDPERRERILKGHEKFEISLMETQCLTYKKAHEKAESNEKTFDMGENLKPKETASTLEDSVELIEPTQEKKSTKDSQTKLLEQKETQNSP
jgi:hypothetical protein